MSVNLQTTNCQVSRNSSSPSNFSSIDIEDSQDNAENTADDVISQSADIFLANNEPLFVSNGGTINPNEISQISTNKQTWEISGVKPSLSLFVTRFDPSTTKQNVESYVLRKLNCTNTKIRCQPLFSMTKDRNDFEYVSFKISCDPKYHEILNSNEFWPENVVVREFRKRNFQMRGKTNHNTFQRQ